MSAFEVTITPTRLKNKKRQESREPTAVVMAPFSAKAIVQFEDVPIGKTAKRLLRIINPSDNSIEVKVINKIIPDLNIIINWSEMTVTGRDEVEMEIIWSPTVELACKESFQLIDNRNFRKDVILILKSRSNKQMKGERKFPTLSSSVKIGGNSHSTHVKTLRLKSPTSGMKSNRVSGQTQQRKFLQKKSKEPNVQWITTTYKSTIVQKRNSVSSDFHTKTAVESSLPLAEKNFYERDCMDFIDYAESVEIGDYNQDEEEYHFKENLSPLTPRSILSAIDNLKFTPLTQKHQISAPIESLASLPTPNVTEHQVNVNDQQNRWEIRPRRLLCADLDTDDLKVNSSTIITDKTFDIKRTEEANIFLEQSGLENINDNMPCNEIVLNKTATINTPHVRLEAITEEETSNSIRESNESTRIVEKSRRTSVWKNKDLKRDVLLVGPALRKYSESMRDLSVGSTLMQKATQGSLPNLNEMDSIHSIDENRYFYKSNYAMSEDATLLLSRPTPIKPIKPGAFLNSRNLLEASENSSPSRYDTFNQNEILAQSSRFNLNETTAVNNTIDTSKDACGANQRKNQKRKCNESWSSESIVKESAIGMCSVPKQGRLKESPSRKAYIERPSFTMASSRGDKITERSKNWSRVQTNKLRISRTLSLVRKPVTPRKIQQEPRIRLYDSELYMQSCINPDPFAATTTCDPFLTSTMYLDESAVDKHQSDIKKWLNALVSIPAELATDCNTKIDVGKLFNEVRHKPVVLAPTKEEHCLHYLTDLRLESLRRAAVQVFLSEELRVPCSKIAVYVNKRTIRIRNDRNLHLDVVMQRYILELLLCFNPLWLRLGLEVVFGEKIHLQSNKDIIGLSSFILNRLFRDTFLEQKYSKAYTLSDDYSEHIKKFTLQKMLHLLLFLDKAKLQRIIKHNPCLFIKKSPYKETREILLKFSSEMLANIGDITRELKRLGYVLWHKQTFLDEFDYAFDNLATDLRDGIRLTRIMEIILLRDDLTKQLRVPANSRLQRIFNVNLALRALSEADFELKGNITSADVVDGHREKTLSLLWQIIYKFRSPKFHAAATILQKWWRKLWLRVVIERRVRCKAEQRRHDAATRIQAAFRGQLTRLRVQLYRQLRSTAAIVLQKYTRGYLARREIVQKMQAVTTIQRWYRAQCQRGNCRQRFLQLRNAAVLVQRRFRALKQMRQQRAAYRTLRGAVICVQRRFQAQRLMRTQRMQYSRLRFYVVQLQRRFRAIRIMRIQRETYQQQRRAACVIQTHMRAIWKQRRQHLERSVVVIQRRYRANKLMKSERLQYLRLRANVIIVQQRFRAIKSMRHVRAEYLQQRSAAIRIQQYVRAWRAMNVVRADYQRTHQAIRTLQTRFRAKMAMRVQHEWYQVTRTRIIWVQRKWRSILQGREQRERYMKLRQCVMQMQYRFRGQKSMRLERERFLKLRSVVLCVQRRFRAVRHMREQRAVFICTQTAIVVVQRRFRAQMQMRKERAAYQRMKSATVCVQRHVRGYFLMQRQRAHFLRLRAATVVLQRAFRARRQAAKVERAVVLIQKWYRATLSMRRERHDFVELRRSSIQVQRFFRGFLQMRRARKEFQLKRAAASRIAVWYRAMRSMHVARSQYHSMRQAALVLQQRFRARRTMMYVRNQFLLIRSLVICLQRKYRARRAMLQTRQEFLVLRSSCVYVQQKFRGLVQMRFERRRFVFLRGSVVHFQAQARGYLARKRLEAFMTPEMVELLRQKKAAKVIQRFWRGYRIRKTMNSVRLALIQQNIAFLKSTATAVDTVRFKVQNAVHLLRGRFNVSEALNMLKQLERVSRTVPHLLMEHSSFISNFCYGIMAQAIRSEIDKLLIEYSSRIILNLARYNSTTANTFQESGLVTIAQMLLRWCDKDCEIFNILCTLVWVFTHCPRKCEIIRNFMTTTEAIYFVRETKKLVARKEKMKQHVRNQAIIQKGKDFSSRSLPSLEPDYGVICNKPYVFISSVFAFETVLARLRINNI